MSNLDAFLKKYKIDSSRMDIIEEALTHSSYANEHQTTCYERLEFLGDAVLGILVAEFIYKNYPDLPEGKMTKLRATYVCEDANYKYAQELEIGSMIRLGHGEEMSGGRTRPTVLNDVFEALLGAIYLTNGLEKVREILSDVVFPHIGKDIVKPFVDYKSKLQEYIQTETRSVLQYRLDDVVGPPHDRTFTMSVSLDGIKLGVGIGKSKKDAEQLAAKAALDKMVQ
ncbi:MAG: ribonuclease III [Bacilli bacterium]|nr:ribonuclease III [Bacilli bacterium]